MIKDFGLEKIGSLTRIILLIVFYIIIFSAQSLISILTLTVVVFLFSIFMKVSIKGILKTLLAFSVMYVLGLVPAMIFFGIKSQAIFGFILFFLKTFSLMTCNKIFVTGMSINEVTALIKKTAGKLGFNKIDVFEISTMLMISIRFFNIIFEQTERSVNALKCRGISFKTWNLLRNIRVIFLLISNVIDFTFHQAESLATALEIRCYGLYNDFEDEIKFVFNLKEITSLIFSLILLGVIIFCNSVKI